MLHKYPAFTIFFSSIYLEGENTQNLFGIKGTRLKALTLQLKKVPQIGLKWSDAQFSEIFQMSLLANVVMVNAKLIKKVVINRNLLKIPNRKTKTAYKFFNEKIVDAKLNFYKLECLFA